MKTNLKKELHDLLKGCNSVDTVYYYDGTFHIIKDCKLIEIPKSEAFQYLESESDFWNLIEDKRKFDTDSSRWIGEIPVHIQPSGLPICKTTNITTAFPTIEFLNFHIGLIKDASNNPRITGIQIIKDI